MSESNVETGLPVGCFGETARSALAASALLLCAPDERIRAQFRIAGAARDQPLETLRQSFYDRFCIPQSGLYIPPFEHVFRHRERRGGHWHFPPARFGGACAVEAVYARLGFRHTLLYADPMLRAPHLPGDHLGFMLAFVGWVLEGAERNPTAKHELTTCLDEFVATHLDGWVDAYCDLLQETEPHSYPATVGEALHEAIAEVRRAMVESGMTAATESV